MKKLRIGPSLGLFQYYYFFEIILDVCWYNQRHSQRIFSCLTANWYPRASVCAKEKRKRSSWGWWQMVQISNVPYIFYCCQTPQALERPVRIVSKKNPKTPLNLRIERTPQGKWSVRIFGRYLHKVRYNLIRRHMNLLLRIWRQNFISLEKNPCDHKVLQDRRTLNNMKL